MIVHQNAFMFTCYNKVFTKSNSKSFECTKYLNIEKLKRLGSLRFNFLIILDKEKEDLLFVFVLMSLKQYGDKD